MTPVETETRRRIKLSVWAYAYEIAPGDDTLLASDWLFDLECKLVDLNVRTNRPDLDMWFVINFNPNTGMWIYKHPELPRIKELYEEFYKNDKMV